ncbi:MAG: 30S ribosomal protein S5 [bacterium]|nr:30S ribosomal protein S5 [bacterium]
MERTQEATKNKRPRPSVNPAETQSEYSSVVLQVDRISRTVKGGRRIRFRTLVIIGNKNGRVGMGVAKANEVATAVAKATTDAKKNMVNIALVNGTIPHEITIKMDRAKIIMKPAKEGTSIIAGSAVRTVAELAGIRDLNAKVIGSATKINIARTTLTCLSSLRVREKGNHDKTKLA